MFIGLSFGDTRIKDVINRIQSCSSLYPALAVPDIENMPCPETTKHSAYGERGDDSDNLQSLNIVRCQRRRCEQQNKQ